MSPVLCVYGYLFFFVFVFFFVCLFFCFFLCVCFLLCSGSFLNMYDFKDQIKDARIRQ